MEHQATIQEVVSQIISTAGIISAACAPATFGFIEAIKKMGLQTRFIGIITIIVGFFLAILFGKLFLGTFWSPLNIAIGIIVGFGTPGAYSAIVALKGNKTV